MANRLAKESSPYLSQHQDNPVDWYPWGEEAFARAKREDKPIFLSIGYSSCHWCHVMEHESFESQEIAAILNESFVSIKVDREERPDVDEAYMTAVQIGSGRGGWPISAFLTPDGDPFFAGTYFPPENRGDHPGFKTVLEQIRQLWAADRPKVQGFADEYAQALRQSLTQSLDAADVVLGADLLDACVQAHTLEFDEESGGFAPAPKFPPHSAIEFLLTYALIEEAPEEVRQAAADMALTTLHQMAMSGLQDVVGGGFHRYSTDPHWHLPHFEKMLYDNALLLGNYARAAAMCHGQMPELEKVFDRVCNKIVGWLKREMTSPEGIFYSALDADSDGEEGKFYVWTHDEISRLLGEDSASFLNAFQVHKEGNFHDEASGVLTGQNVLHPVEVLGDRFDQELRMLLEAREQKVRPSLDNKALVGWNGLAIGALAEAGEIEMAERAAEAILKAEGEFGSLPRQVVRGVPKGEAYLEDYAYLADGFISLAHAKSLYEAHVGASTAGRSARAWLGEAHRLADVMVTRFYDSSVGGFFATSDQHEDLFGRTKPVFDQPIPSANAVAVRVLIEIGDDSRARACLEHFKGWMAKAPQATEALHLALLGLPGESVPGSEVRVEVPHKKVVVELTSTNLQADQTGLAHGSVLISIPEGQHLNSPNPPARWLTPTAIQFEPPIGNATYPEATDDRYLGNVLIPFEIQLPRGESGADVQMVVSYQACTDSECQLPEEIKFNLLVERIT